MIHSSANMMQTVFSELKNQVNLFLKVCDKMGRKADFYGARKQITERDFPFTVLKHKQPMGDIIWYAAAGSICACNIQHLPPPMISRLTEHEMTSNFRGYMLHYFESDSHVLCEAMNHRPW